VMKTLEKDRTRRYETVHSLAEDVERHLRHEPITASSPGTIYRLQFLRRNREGRNVVGRRCDCRRAAACPWCLHTLQDRANPERPPPDNRFDRGSGHQRRL
jgi:hypothetical protein